MSKSWILSFVLGVVMATEAWAVGPFSMQVKKGDRLQIKGFRGDVTYIVNEQAQNITVQIETMDSQNKATQDAFDEWQFSMRRDGETVLLLVDSPQSKKAWSDLLMDGQKQPRFNLKVIGPSVPLQMNWQQGRFFARDFKTEARLNILEGDVEFIGGEGDVHVHSQRGAVKVLKRRGYVEVDTYEARVEIGEVLGDVKVDNFIGETRITKMEGALSLLSFRGDTRISQVKGRLSFKNGNSPLHIENLQGELRGKSMQGPVYATINGEANIRVESEEGQVNLRLPSSGAWVNLGTEDGALQVPTFLKLTRLPSQQIRSGRLRGNFGGSVFVRTTSGDIRVR